MRNAVIQGVFQQIPGSLAHIAVGSAVWGVSSSGGIYYFDSVGTQRFVEQESPRALPGGPAGTRVAIRSQSIQSKSVITRLFVGHSSINQVWAVDQSGVAYELRWENLPNGRGSKTFLKPAGLPPISQFVVDSNVVYAVDTSQRIWRSQDGQPFQQLPGSLVQIAGILDRELWGVSPSQRVYRFNRATQTFEEFPGSLVQIAEGLVMHDVAERAPQLEVWGSNSSRQIYRLTREMQLFEHVPGSLRQVAVGFNGVWGLNDAQEIFRFNRDRRAFEQVPGRLTQIALSPMSDTGVWGINASGEVYRFREGH